MNTVRETGYYWVRKHASCDWEVWLWNSTSERWSTLTASLQPMLINDEGWSQINETRIKSPDEMRPLFNNLENQLKKFTDPPCAIPWVFKSSQGTPE